MRNAKRSDPLKWWSENQALFLNLSGLTRFYGLASKHLSIPGTSMPSEQLLKGYFLRHASLLTNFEANLETVVINQTVF